MFEKASLSTKTATRAQDKPAIKSQKYIFFPLFKKDTPPDFDLLTLQRRCASSLRRTLVAPHSRCAALARCALHSRCAALSLRRTLVAFRSQPLLRKSTPRQRLVKPSIIRAAGSRTRLWQKYVITVQSDKHTRPRVPRAREYFIFIFFSFFPKRFAKKNNYTLLSRPVL